MRGTRWLILLAITVILGSVAITYRLQNRQMREQAPPKPQPLAPTLSSSAQEWVWVQTSAEGRTVCRITAKDARQVKDSNVIELEQVELRLPSRHGDNYDLVHSAHAKYNQSEKRLYSDGEVDITLAVPNVGTPKHTLVSIHSSGVTFDSTSGKAITDRPTAFIFENGEGKAVGASYDPNTRELHMNSQAELDWRPPGPNAKPMKIEAGEVVYQEEAAIIHLSPWARLTRENTVVEGADTVITLQDRVIHHVDSQKAHGTDVYPNRKLQYGADQLSVDYGDDGKVERIVGTGNGRLVSESQGSRVTATGDRVDLEFADSNGESALAKALVNGNGLLESEPLPVSGQDPAETRILRSQVILVQMREGGREIANLETQSPGTLEFLPNHTGQRHRKFIGDRMWITYGAQNRVQSFRSVNCRTESDPTPEEVAKKRPKAITVSKNVTAAFDPKTSQMTRMEQWDDFSYEAGDRHARADRGILEQTENRITLDKHARMWDSHEATSADRILLDEKSGNFTAEGHVNSSRLPDQDKKKSDSPMLSGDEPLQAVSRTMTSSDHNRLVKYDGEVVLWQTANRIQADHVEIDREKRTLIADGHVITQSREEKKDTDPPASAGPAPATASTAAVKTGSNAAVLKVGSATAAKTEVASATKTGPTAKTKAASTTSAKGDPAPAVFTLVKAAHMVYTDTDRLAHYSGGVFLSRAGLQVKAADLRSWLAEQGADNRLQKAFADGAVEIVQAGPVRTRTGSSEHAEYYTDEEKIILRGGDPQMRDSLRGSTRGAELTYYSDDDRLLVNGTAARPVSSRILRKHP